VGLCYKYRVRCFFVAVNEGSLVTFSVHCFDLSAAKRNITQFNIPSVLSFARTQNVISY